MSNAFTELWRDIVAATAEEDSDITALRIPLLYRLENKQYIGKQMRDVLFAAAEFLHLPDANPIHFPKGKALFCFAHCTAANMNNLLPVAREALKRNVLGGIVMGEDFTAELGEFVGAVPLVSVKSLIGSLPPSVRYKNAASIAKVYRKLAKGLIQRRPALGGGLAANRGSILRDITCSLQFGSVWQQVLANWSPGCVVSTSDFWPLEHQLCRQAASLKIPSLVIQHGVIGDFWWPFVADICCLWGATHVQQLIDLGAPAERLIAVGMPASDGMFRHSNCDASTRNRRRTSPVCLLMSHTHGKMYEKEAFDRYKDFIAEAVKSAPEIIWKVKLHPMEDEEFYRAMGASVFERLNFHPKTVSLLEAVADADVVTTVYSTAGLESMVLNRPLIVAPAISRVQHLAPWPAMGGGIYAETPTDFQSLIMRLTLEKEYREEHLQKQHKFLAASFANQGRAAERIVDLLEQCSRRRLNKAELRCSEQIEFAN